MASPSRRRARDLGEEILTAGHSFRFFQAVRLLALADQGDGPKPPIPERLRFGSPASLTFPASEITAVSYRKPKTKRPPLNSPEATPESAVPAEADTPGTPDTPVAAEDDAEQAGERKLDMTVSFIGMIGPSGVMPTAYTELLIERRNQYRDDTAHQFLDLFTHRAASLFYRAWRKYRFYLPYEAGERDGFSRHLLDLVGVGLRRLQDRLNAAGGGIPDRFLIHYAGLLSQKPISAANIAALVRGYFGVDAALEQFVGQWMYLPIDEQTSLGGGACCLGENAVAGERMWDRQTKVRLKLGPLKSADFAEFLPGRPGLNALKELVRFCVGFTLDCDVNLILRREDIPPPMIPARIPPQLGYNVWLNSRPPREDADEVSFGLFTERA